MGGGGGALRLQSPEWEGPQRRGRGSWAGSYLTGKIDPSGGRLLVKAFSSRKYKSWISVSE